MVEGGSLDKLKIDLTGYDAIPFKKTATLVNYFIMNAA